MIKNRKINIVIAVLCVLLTVCLSSCSSNNNDVRRQAEVTRTLTNNQETPTDINYSLERYNLIRRAYWVNGMREKANTLVCEIQKPLGYIVLFTEGGGVVGRFVVDGKITSLNSFLTQSIAYYNGNEVELADVDGSYGENDQGIFFFTPDGKYIEWNGTYLYSDIPFDVDEPIVKIDGEK